MSNEVETHPAGVGTAASAFPTLQTFEAPVLPDWVLFHVPHDSIFIPPTERCKLLLNDTELKTELLRITDHFTSDLFAQGIPGSRILYSPVSRLLVDVERFEKDALEVMASRGMGAVYERTSERKATPAFSFGRSARGIDEHLVLSSSPPADRTHTTDS